MNLKSMMKAKGVPKPEEESELKMGMQHEAAEHAWLSPAQIRRLTQDHLKENPEYYSELKEMEDSEDEAHEKSESKEQEESEHEGEEEEKD